MKTPVQMLETVAADIIENTALLESIYRNSSENHETNCAIACLIRSMQKTLDTANGYVNILSSEQNNTAKMSVDFSDAVSGAMLNINKICVVGSRYSDAVFSDMDNDDENCLMFRTLIDFAREAKRKLKTAENELFN